MHKNRLFNRAEEVGQIYLGAVFYENACVDSFAKEGNLVIDHSRFGFDIGFNVGSHTDFSERSKVNSFCGKLVNVNFNLALGVL